MPNLLALVSLSPTGAFATLEERFLLETTSFRDLHRYPERLRELGSNQRPSALFGGRRSTN